MGRVLWLEGAKAGVDAMASPASYAVDEERREEARALRGRRRDELLASWGAEGAGAEAGVDTIAMAMTSPASYADDKERRKEARALRGRRRDELLASWEAEGAGAEAGVDAIAMKLALPASYAVNEERREEARALRGRRRDELALVVERWHWGIVGVSASSAAAQRRVWWSGWQRGGGRGGWREERMGQRWQWVTVRNTPSSSSLYGGSLPATNTGMATV